MSTNQILTAHPAKKHGIPISRELYDTLSRFIIETVSSDNNSTSMRLLVEADARFAELPNLYWYVIHVKLDLEARGFIQIASSSSQKSKFLKVTMKGLKEFGRLSLQ
jgi:hypothetical protein